MNLGQRIKSQREAKGLTQDDLAAISGVCQQMISKLETGRSEHTADIIKLACALDVSPLWLEGLADESSDLAPQKNLSLHHRAVMVCIEFLSTEVPGFFAGSGFRKQADLFCRCYEVCTRPGSKTLAKKDLFALLKKQLR
ncbi:MAG: helix-turn-helix transcriptional regulator [Gammaproteobacteria bacterium]|nr:helix-turn-helix transcriptional regulator [Gammaproteobacteria bacterium]